jgi:hypothetical protein
MKFSTNVTNSIAALPFTTHSKVRHVYKFSLQNTAGASEIQDE